LRDAGRRGAADVRVLRQRLGRDPLQLPALPREPTSGGVRLRRDADQADLPGPRVGPAASASVVAAGDRSSGPGAAFAREREEVETMIAPITLDMMRELVHAFNRHDVDAMLSDFAVGAVVESPGGADPARARCVG